MVLSGDLTGLRASIEVLPSYSELTTSIAAAAIQETQHAAFATESGFPSGSPSPSLSPSASPVVMPRTSKWNYLVSGLIWLVVTLSAASTLLVVVIISRRRAKMVKSKSQHRKSEFVSLNQVADLFRSLALLSFLDNEPVIDTSLARCALSGPQSFYIMLVSHLGLTSKAPEWADGAAKFTTRCLELIL